MKIQETFINPRGKTFTRIFEVSNLNMNLFKRFITSNQDNNYNLVLTNQKDDNTIITWRLVNGELNASIFKFNVQGKTDIYWLPDETMNLEKGQYVSSKYEAEYILSEYIDNINVINEKI